MSFHLLSSPVLYSCFQGEEELHTLLGFITMLFEMLTFYILRLSPFHLISFHFLFFQLPKSFEKLLKWLLFFLSSPFSAVTELHHALMFWISFCFSVRTESKLIAWYPFLAVPRSSCCCYKQNNRLQEYNHIFLFTVFCDLLSGHSGVEFSVFACINQVESCQVIHYLLSHSWLHEEEFEDLFHL